MRVWVVCIVRARAWVRAHVRYFDGLSSLHDPELQVNRGIQWHLAANVLQVDPISHFYSSPGHRAWIVKEKNPAREIHKPADVRQNVVPSGSQSLFQAVGSPVLLKTILIVRHLAVFIEDISTTSQSQRWSHQAPYKLASCLKAAVRRSLTSELIAR